MIKRNKNIIEIEMLALNLKYINESITRDTLDQIKCIT